MLVLRKYDGRRFNLTRVISRTSSTNNATHLNTPDFNSFPSFLKDVEARWKMKLMRRFDRERYVGSKEELACGKPPRYVLSMFPYPSGRLHLGHVRIYTSADILTRFSRLMSKNANSSLDYNHVINPMGFDSFGLPAENAAKERGLHPASWTNSNIRTMKAQMDDLALQFDWREATSNPSFYKWTQAIFLKLMDAGLVYKSFATVNWDPIDKTVLADEQVDGEGRSWRSGALVEKRNYRQWFIKVNSFIKDVYEAPEVDVETWGDILAIQRSWIGKPCGWLFYLSIGSSSDILPIFTKIPEMFMQSDTEILISNDHWLEKIYHISEKGFIDNFFTGSKLKVTLTDNPDSLPLNGYATLISSKGSQEDAIVREQVLLTAKLNNLGGYYTSDKYRDWLISRQRFWGTPIPVARCENCGYSGVPKESLPVKLPSVQNINQKAESPKHENIDINDILTPIKGLAHPEWLNLDCPSCGSESKRECETFDTLFDSSWYFLRYATNPPENEPFDSQRVQPVWCYIGGKEHASMHLFYARFITHFLHSLNELKFKEPFKKLLVQGVVKSRTYKQEGKYLSQSEVNALADNSKLTIEYEKMSKSKGNGVDPQDLIDNYGADATRFCLMDYANPKSERLWRSEKEEMKDVLNFLRRVTLTVEDYLQASVALTGNESERAKIKISDLSEQDLGEKKSSLNDARNRSSLDATFHIQESNLFRQYIVAIHQLLAPLRANSKNSSIYTREYAEALASLIVMLNPLTPHLSEELWLHFSKCLINPLRHNSKYDISLQASDQPWPLVDDDYPLLIKVRSEKADDYADRIQVSKNQFENMNRDQIAELVESHFRSRGDSCVVKEVRKYRDLTAIVIANIDSVNQKMAEKRKKKKSQEVDS